MEPPGYINSAGPTSILGPVLRPGFLATRALMTGPVLVGSDGVRVIDHRHGEAVK